MSQALVNTSHDRIATAPTLDQARNLYEIPESGHRGSILSGEKYNPHRHGSDLYRRQTERIITNLQKQGPQVGAAGRRAML